MPLSIHPFILQWYLFLDVVFASHNYALIFPPHIGEGGKIIKALEEAKMNWEDELKNMERKEVQELVIERERDRMSLKFEKVTDRIYRVVNSRTGRFHNMELGIDMVV